MSKPLLTEHHRQNRLRWAQHHKATDWNQMIFSDETTVRLNSAKGLVWNFPGNKKVVRTVKHPIKVNACGCFPNYLKLLGRNYYSFDKKIDRDRFKSILFPGQLMINVDLSTKVMHKQTIYSGLMDKFNRINDTKQTQDASLKELVGQIILAPIKIQIASAKALFFLYLHKYDIKIKDEQQPLISVKASKLVAKGGPKKEDLGLIFLIPESCSITDISDAMRQDFSLMKEMSVYTHIEPNNRYEQVTDFLNHIQRRNELNNCHISLDNKLVELTGRTMKTESIIYKEIDRVPSVPDISLMHTADATSIFQQVSNSVSTAIVLPINPQSTGCQNIAKSQPT
ncbi:unnamed protein product [Rotaria magnacalcarata]|uniref:PAZ domain-containing protein n=1 Tax=Rotaria magnacalcarata TaxID=392030 RepID=A0A820DI60_9BILA|nr:unnamed protein product [Rotaria magnacalcarata]